MIVAVVAAAVHHLLLKYKLHLQLQFHLFQNNLVALLDNIGQMDLALLILLLIIYLQNAHQALKVMDMEIVFLLHQDKLLVLMDIIQMDQETVLEIHQFQLQILFAHQVLRVMEMETVLLNGSQLFVIQDLLAMGLEAAFQQVLNYHNLAHQDINLMDKETVFQLKNHWLHVLMDIIQMD